VARGSPLIAVLAAAAALALSCNEPAHQQAPARVVFCLFDISGSTAHPDVRQRYMSEFEMLLSKLEGGATLMGDVITGNTLATASYPIRREFPAKGTFGNPLEHSRQTRQATDAALEEARRPIIDGAPAESTDLLNAFYLPAKVFSGETYATCQAIALIVFSDMALQNKSYDFTGIDLTDERIDEIIASERDAQGGLPDLSGVEVWVVGAAAAADGGLPPAKLKQIEAFWRRYFEAYGAHMPGSNYGAALLHFDLSLAEPQDDG